MQYLFGGGNSNKKNEKKINPEIIIEKTKQALKQEFCQICQKNFAVKVAFGSEIQSTFTCAVCQLQAVGGSIQCLGQKNLISTEKFGSELTKQLTTYQFNKEQPPQQYKENMKKTDNSIQALHKIEKNIKQELKNLQNNTKIKMQQLIHQSEQQNIIPVFQDVIKMIKDKKIDKLQNGSMLLKRAMVGCKGLQFSDQIAIQKNNAQINQKVSIINKEVKLKSKQISNLIDEINNIEFE